MKKYVDEAVAEVRAARKAMCDRFDNDPRRLLAHLRAEQEKYKGRLIKSWPEAKHRSALNETPQ